MIWTIFGRGSLFELLSRRGSGPARERLPDWLTQPAAPQEVVAAAGRRHRARTCMDLREALRWQVGRRSRR